MNELLPTINGFDFALIAVIFGMLIAILTMASTISRLRYQRGDWRMMCLDTAKELKDVGAELFKVKAEKGLNNIVNGK